MRSKRLPGLPVLALDDGARLGRTRRALVDPRRRRVAALVVAQKGWNQHKLLPMERVHALGSHAVTVERADALIPIKEAAEYEHLLKEDRWRVPGAPVITAGGELVGTVRDFEIAGNGAVEALYVARHGMPSLFGKTPAIPGEFIIALGKDAVLVANEAMSLVSPPEKPVAPSAGGAGERAKPGHKAFSWLTKLGATDPGPQEKE